MDTNEHILMGDRASISIPQLLGIATNGKMDAYKGPNTGSKDRNIFDRGGWFDLTVDQVQNQTAPGQFRIGGTATDPSQTEDWISYGDILALSGDYFEELSGIIKDPDATKQEVVDWQKMIQAHKVDDKAGTDHMYSTMVQRATRNFTHFGHVAIDQWLKLHKLAIQIAIDGRNGALKPKQLEDIGVSGMGYSQTVAGLLLALRQNAFADHYLTDLFSAAHMRVQRQEFHDYLGGGKDVALNITGALQQPVAFLAKALKIDTVPDVASIVSGIAHDEDGQWGLWCKTFFPLGTKAFPGSSGTSMVPSSFFALGDDYFDDVNNSDTKFLCSMALQMSIQDILIASTTGKDPASDPPADYWKLVDGPPNPKPVYCALTIVPRPDPPNPAWKSNGTAAAANKAGGMNHFPFMKPDIGFSAYFDGLRDHMAGLSQYQKPSSFTVRKMVTDLADLDMVKGGDLGAKFGWLPGSSAMGAENGYLIGKLTKLVGAIYSPAVLGDNDYFDYQAYWKGGDAAAKVSPDAWQQNETLHMAGRYADFKEIKPLEAKAVAIGL